MEDGMDEYLNRDVKAHLSETKISKTADELTEAVRSHLAKKDKTSVQHNKLSTIFTISGETGFLPRFL